MGEEKGNHTHRVDNDSHSMGYETCWEYSMFDSAAAHLEMEGQSPFVYIEKEETSVQLIIKR